jgi:phenylacetate-CoA ligase
VGYVSSLVEFTGFLTRPGLRIPPIKAVLAAAEPLCAHIQEQIAAALGAPVFNTYGSREFMSLAAGCENHEGLQIKAESVLIETTLPPGAGPLPAHLERYPGSSAVPSGAWTTS